MVRIPSFIRSVMRQMYAQPISEPLATNFRCVAAGYVLGRQVIGNQPVTAWLSWM